MPCRLSFSCRQFRRQHAEYMDGYLSDEAQLTCRAHLDACPACGHHDVQIRRSLLALQALPMIEPSAGFHDRLRARLSREALHYAPGHSQRVRWGVATTIIAASVALLFASSSRSDRIEPIRAVPALARAVDRRAPERPTPVRPAAIQAGTIPGIPAITAPGSSARFEALSRQGSVRSWPSSTQGLEMRLRTVSYLGQ